MAIQTVTNENLTEYVKTRTQLGSQIATEAEVAAQAAKTEDKGPTPGNPVIKTGEEKLEGAPEPSNEEPTAKKRKDNPVQPRIDELTRERKEMEEFAESEYNLRLEAERRASELEAEVQRLKPKEVTQPEEKPKPKPEDFKTTVEYAEALAEWTVDQKLKAREAAEAKQRAQELANAQHALLQERTRQAQKDIADFDEVIQGAQDINLPPHIQGAILESDEGPLMAYLMAKDRGLYEKIVKLPPAKSIVELSKAVFAHNQEAFAQSHPRDEQGKFVPKTPETSKAPAPISAVRADSKGIVETDLSKPMSFSEYKAKRREELKRKRH